MRILRAIDSLQLTDAHKVADTGEPERRRPGQQSQPSLSDEDARKGFPNGWTTVTPYRRVVFPQLALRR